MVRRTPRWRRLQGSRGCRRQAEFQQAGSFENLHGHQHSVIPVLLLRRSTEDFRDHLRDPENVDRPAAGDLPGTPVTDPLHMQPCACAANLPAYSRSRTWPA